MTTLSKPEDNADTRYGSYVAMVPSKKKGCKTSVRRSLRNQQDTATPSYSEKKIKLEGAIKEGEEMDELITTFQTTLKVDNHSLEVRDVKTKIVTFPDSKVVGRRVTFEESNDACGGNGVTITPVKRSARRKSLPRL